MILLAVMLAHSWYSQACCGGSHCHPVACTTLVTNSDGSVDWTGLHFAPEQVHASQDALCHVCVAYPAHTRGRAPLCAFVASTT